MSVPGVNAMATRFSILEVPSSLGLSVSGVELLPRALKKAGLMDDLQADYIGQVDIPFREAQKDRSTLLLNPHSIRECSLRLADKTTDIIGQGKFPVVLGGDCSILIGCMLALRRLGRYGLFFIDGHADFFQPEAEPNGEVASMELAIVSGRGPDILTDIDNLKPLLQDDSIVAFGYRDLEDQKEYGSQDISKTAIANYDLGKVRELGFSKAVQKPIETLQRKNLDGVWIHCDADVLDDSIMPAVDYRVPGGLQWFELTEVLSALMESGIAVGISITIFNPELDPDGTIAKRFSRSITDGLLRY